MCRRLLVAIGATALASTSLVLAPETAVAQHYGRGGELRAGAAVQAHLQRLHRREQ